MTTPTSTSSRENIAFGLFLILLASAILFFAGSIRVNDFGNHDPGPRTIPRAMAIIMLLGGIYEIVAAWRTKSSVSQINAPRIEPPSSTTDHRRGFFVFVGLIAYLIVMNWLGFVVSTIVFSTLALISLKSRWWTALLSSVCIAIIVQVLFVKLFHVSLPTGPWGGF